MITDLHICITELKFFLYLNYDLEDAIIDRLEFDCNTKIGNNGKVNYVRIEDEGSELFTKKIRRMMASVFTKVISVRQALLTKLYF